MAVRWPFLTLIIAATSLAEPTWERQPTALGIGIAGRWTKDVVTGGSGRAIAVSGAGPAANLSGSFGWSRGAFRLGGLGSYELMIDPDSDLEVRSSGPLLPLTESALRVRTAHFFSLGPFVGAQAGTGAFRGFADFAVVVDLMAAEIDEVGTRLGLRFVPTARVGLSVDVELFNFELWVVGSTLVAPRVGLVMALGF